MTGWLTALRQYPVTVAIALLAAVLSVAAWRSPPLGELLYPSVFAWYGEPWRLVTSTLLHGNVLHLLSNLFWLWLLGSRLEKCYGSAAMLAICLLLAIGTDAAEYALTTGSIGLSGVVFGLCGLLWVLGRWDEAGQEGFYYHLCGLLWVGRRGDRRVAGVSDKLLWLFGLWYVLGLVLTSRGEELIANHAHAVGLILGLLLGCTLVTRRYWRIGFGTLLTGVFLLTLLGGAIKPLSGEEWAALGARDLQFGRLASGRDHLLRAVARDPNQADWWYNLGYAHQETKHKELAATAFGKALALAPGNEPFAEAANNAKEVWACERIEARDIVRAIALLREVVAERPRNDHGWYNLGVAYYHAGQVAHARQAFQRACDLVPGNEPYRRAVQSLWK